MDHATGGILDIGGGRFSFSRGSWVVRTCRVPNGKALESNREWSGRCGWWRCSPFSVRFHPFSLCFSLFKRPRRRRRRLVLFSLFCGMEESGQGTFNQPETVTSSAAADNQCECEHALDAAVDGFDAQKNSFAADALRPSSLYDHSACDDVDLLHGIPQEFTVKYGCGLSDDDPNASGHLRGKRLKRTPVLAEFYIHDQRETANLEDCFVSMFSRPGEPQLYGESYNVGIQSEAAGVTVASQAFCSSSTSNAIDSRRRRAKIAEGIKALEESTPQSGKGTREAVLDDAIDYIKYLKLQLLALGQSRLGGEPVHHPFVHLEGFGHFIIHQEMGSEPLEEVMGHLIESNMPAAIRLLESKGLELLPISSADLILRAGAPATI